MGLRDYEKHFGIVAKRIEGKGELELAFDLRDFEALLLGEGTGKGRENAEG
ncbi:hypothetical protein [Thermococcus sp.]|uniref:hypothetical protein n=1 Tax=Thermococcus sp. TaxID=35749 RepID=UPI0025D7074F|nr:hypothetical protein [Thermococcus sp.]